MSIQLSCEIRVGRGSALSMGRIGLDRVGSQNSLSWVGRVGSDPVSKIYNKYTIYTQEND